jgi:hypothetical protein
VIENTSKIFIKKPINNAPMQLTKRVPAGNLLFTAKFINWLEKYRNNAPSPPPTTMHKQFITISSCQ